ncbi:hypothetical protein VPHK24_0021 [Vibrio phage K24]|nr:hypothetical protein SIPHO078v2_p0019 [Vibrio phage 14E30.1]
MMIDKRTKSICNKKFTYPNASTLKEHQEFMFESSRSLWKQHTKEIKNKTK